MMRTNTSIYVNFPALFPETAIVCPYPATLTSPPVERFHKRPRVSSRKQYGVWNGSTRSRQSQSSQELGHQIRQILQAFRSH